MSLDDPTNPLALEQLTALPGVLHVLLVRSDGLLVARGSAEASLGTDDLGAELLEL